MNDLSYWFIVHEAILALPFSNSKVWTCQMLYADTLCFYTFEFILELEREWSWKEFEVGVSVFSPVSWKFIKKALCYLDILTQWQKSEVFYLNFYHLKFTVLSQKLSHIMRREENCCKTRSRQQSLEKSESKLPTHWKKYCRTYTGDLSGQSM